MKSKSHGGLSLLELIVVLAVISVISAVAVPYWRRLMAVNHLESSMRQVQSELNHIKMRSVAENVGYQLGYLQGASTYTIQQGTKVVSTNPLPEGIVILKSGKITFSPRGTAGANRVRLRSHEGLCKHVIVSATGRVRVCKPNSCNEDC